MEVHAGEPYPPGMEPPPPPFDPFDLLDSVPGDVRSRGYFELQEKEDLCAGWLAEAEELEMRAAEEAAVAAEEAAQQELLAAAAESAPPPPSTPVDAAFELLAAAEALLAGEAQEAQEREEAAEQACAAATPRLRTGPAAFIRAAAQRLPTAPPPLPFAQARAAMRENERRRREREVDLARRQQVVAPVRAPNKQPFACLCVPSSLLRVFSSLEEGLARRQQVERDPREQGRKAALAMIAPVRAPKKQRFACLLKP
jgi:hypothetical protein